MGWKKIMNREKKEIPVAEQEQYLSQYLTKLLPKLNMQLFLDMDVSDSSCLWVESVTVTSYQNAPAKEPSCPEKAYIGAGSIAVRIFHRLTGHTGTDRDL